MLSGKIGTLMGLIALGLICIGIGLPAAAHGQDIIGVETQRVETVTGPYRMIAEAKPLPSLQSVQFIIRVWDAATGEPVEDLTVSILTSWSESDETGNNVALSPNIPGLYTATLTFEPGRWETVFDLEPQGGASYGAEGFVFDIPEPSRNLEAGYVFLGIFAALLIGAGYLVWRVRRNQRQRAEQQGTTAL